MPGCVTVIYHIVTSSGKVAVNPIRWNALGTNRMLSLHGSDPSFITFYVSKCRNSVAHRRGLERLAADIFSFHDWFGFAASGVPVCNVRHAELKGMTRHHMLQR